MQTFGSKVEHMSAARWDGDDDEALVHELRNAGWKVVFQQPETDEMDVWEWEDEESEKVPTPSRMLVIGPYRGQFWHADAGRYLVYHAGSGEFRTWSEKELFGHWVADATAGSVAMPTPQQLHEEKNPAKVDEPVAL